MVSVIIPTKNEEACLPILLSSLARQTLRPREIIVADANSTDQTRSIAAANGATVVQGGLPGPGRNAGARVAASDILVFFDADVELTDPAFLERSVDEMRERELDLATCDVAPLSGSRADCLLHGFYNKYTRLWGARLPHAPGFCLFVRKGLHEAINGFDETVVFCEDHDYARRAARRGRFGFLKEPVPVSVRRLDRDGRFNIAVKFALAELHLATLGPIRHHWFNYQFGHKKDNN